MIDDRSSRPESALDDSFERYLQDKGKGRGGDGGNYRRNAARELERFAEWAAGDRRVDVEWVRCLFARSGTRWLPGISIIPKRWFESGTLTLRQAN